MKCLNVAVLIFAGVAGIVCTDNAFAAGSVRRLGGTGTYNGTSSATRGTAAARAGALRVSPSRVRPVTASTNVNVDGDAAPTQRLSLGKYLGGSTTVSTNVQTQTGPSAAEVDDINNQINNLYEITNRIENEIAAKQDTLQSGDYIVIENDEVSLDIAELENYLTANLDLPNKVKIEYDNATKVLKWSEDGGTTWAELINIADLMGDYASKDELQDTIATLAAKSDLTALTNRVVTLESAIGDIVIPEQQQANWTETDANAKSYIKNKPTDLVSADDLAPINQKVTTLETSMDSLADVAFTGSYNDLTDKPDVSAFQVKPTSDIAEGKVLTYTGNDANANVSASYIKIPVSAGAPSTVAPTGFVELWLQ